MNPDLVHSTRNGTALDQGMKPIRPQGSKIGLCRLTRSLADLSHTIIHFKDGCIHQFILEVLDAIHHGMVELRNFPVLKLHTEVAIRLRVFGKCNRAGRVFI